MRAMLIIFLVVPLSLYGQSKVDSLRELLHQTPTPAAQLPLLKRLITENQYADPDLALKYCDTLLAHAEMLNNTKFSVIGFNLLADILLTNVGADSALLVYKTALQTAESIEFNPGISTALIGIGKSHWRKANYDEALIFFKQNLVHCETYGDSAGIGSSYNNIGNIYNELRDYSKAMEHFVLATKYYQSINNVEYYATALSNIGMIQSKLNNYESAESYYLLSDSLFRKINDINGVAYIQKSLSILYKNTDRLDKALSSNIRARNLFDQIGDQYQVQETYYNLGNIYWRKNDLTSAIKQYEASLAIAHETDDSASMAYSCSAIAAAYLQLKQDKNAEPILKRGAKIANNIGLSLIEMDAYELLSSMYASQHKHELAYDYHVLFTAIKDTLYTQEKEQYASEIEARYQNDQKAQKIALLESENEIKALTIKQRGNQRNLIFIVALALLLIAGLLYNQFKVKQKANNKLKELDQLKSNFFTNISHEFRTPLTLIEGPLTDLEQNPKDRLDIGIIKMMRRNTNRLLNLVNQLLDLSAIEEGSLKLNLKEGDVIKCLNEIVITFNSKAAGQLIDYRVSLPDQMYWTNFDRDKVEKIMYNLLGNAFKYCEAGAAITFNAEVKDQVLQVMVNDTGIGIPSANLPYIFDRFYQIDAENTNGKEGTGIGLALTKSLVELMDGTIAVASEKNKGTFFTVQIPLPEIKTGNKNKITIANQQHYAAGLKNNTSFPIETIDGRSLETILLVEDNEDMRNFIKSKLLPFYRVETAVNGEEGLSKAGELVPDLIITDLMMPKLDGLAFCKQLKTNFDTSHLPIIMLTAKAGTENKIEGLETGADDYLIKPFNQDELVARVKNLIYQRQQLKSIYTNSQLTLDPKQIAATSIDQKFLANVLALLEERHTDPDFGVPQMNEALAVSKAQLHRKLKALTNEAPGELLRNFRLKRATQLIALKSDSVTQIAFSVGFNNPSYFTKCFKAYFGLTPSEWADKQE